MYRTAGYEVSTDMYLNIFARPFRRPRSSPQVKCRPPVAALGSATPIKLRKGCRACALAYTLFPRPSPVPRSFLKPNPAGLFNRRSSERKFYPSGAFPSHPHGREPDPRNPRAHRRSAPEERRRAQVKNHRRCAPKGCPTAYIFPPSHVCPT